MASNVGIAMNLKGIEFVLIENYSHQVAAEESGVEDNPDQNDLKKSLINFEQLQKEITALSADIDKIKQRISEKIKEIEKLETLNVSSSESQKISEDPKKSDSVFQQVILHLMNPWNFEEDKAEEVEEKEEFHTPPESEGEEKGAEEVLDLVKTQISFIQNEIGELQSTLEKLEKSFMQKKEQYELILKELEKADTQILPQEKKE